jgi:hypothetical protein
MELENREMRVSWSRLEEQASTKDNYRGYFSREQWVTILGEHWIEAEEFGGI